MYPRRLQHDRVSGPTSGPGRFVPGGRAGDAACLASGEKRRGEVRPPASRAAGTACAGVREGSSHSGKEREVLQTLHAIPN